MLKLKKVTKYYDNKCAVNNLSFEVKKGEIFGLLGLNGAGKTTTFRMILNLIDDYSGEITFNGKKINYDMTDEIGFLTEERSLLTRMSVYEQIIFYGRLKGMNEIDIEKKLDYYLDFFNIKEYKNRKIKELSKGNQQKIQFISAIINDPKLLILDEPFTGLDPVSVEEFKKIILKLKKEGTTIIFSSHRMEHVELFCEKLLILVEGNTVLEGNIKDIKENYKKKNIKIIGNNIDINKLSGIDGVISVDKNDDEVTVKISDDTKVGNIFNYIKSLDEIKKFEVNLPSLNEIFVSVVGKNYDKDSEV